ncbi:MAG: GNAT family N-acetyltransferase [Acidimicrobiales bacterium]
MTITYDDDIDAVDWVRAKADLAADEFDNGRTPEALRRSFAASTEVRFAYDGDHCVGMARLLSDGVCNAYLIDVWTHSGRRRQGIGSAIVSALLERVPGQHVGLQTDDRGDFYGSLGFKVQPEFFGHVVGRWLDNDANH